MKKLQEEKEQWELRAKETDDAVARISNRNIELEQMLASMSPCRGAEKEELTLRS